MSGRAEVEKALEEEGKNKLFYVKVGLALGFAFSAPAMIFFGFMAKLTIREPNYWLVMLFAIMAAFLSCLVYAFRKREETIRDCVRMWNTEMERRRVQAEQDRIEASRRAALAARQAEQERHAAAERTRKRREWEREEAARKAAEELAATENKVRVLWADFQATHNFTGEIPAEVMRQRFHAEIRKRLTAHELTRLNSSQNGDVARLIGA